MTVRWTRLAIEDLEGARDYIAAENPRAAAQAIQRIGKTVSMLSLHPELGRPGRVQRTRELVVAGTPFVVAYRVLGNTIAILAVIHAARKWPEAF